MADFEASQWAECIRRYKNPLLVVGEGCGRISLDGQGLLHYAVALAEKLSCPVAATGNMLPAVRKQGRGLKVKKMFVAELFRSLEEEWQEPFLEERPDLLLLLGYRPRMIQGMAAGVEQVHMVHLGPGELPAARLSMGDVPLDEWKRNLDALVDRLQAVG